MHARTIPIFTHFLTALDGVLAKAEAHCEANAIKPEALLEFRLFPDMMTLTRQVQLAIRNKAKLSITVNRPDGSQLVIELEPSGIANGRLRGLDHRPSGRG